MKHWKSGSIHNRLILITLAPAVLLGLTLFIYFVAARLNDVQQQQHEAGELIVKQLASTAEYGVLTGHLVTLENLVAGALQISDVVSVDVYDREDRLLIRLPRAQKALSARITWYSARISCVNASLWTMSFICSSSEQSLIPGMTISGEYRLRSATRRSAIAGRTYSGAPPSSVSPCWPR